MSGRMGLAGAFVASLLGSSACGLGASDPCACNVMNSLQSAPLECGPTRLATLEEGIAESCAWTKQADPSNGFDLNVFLSTGCGVATLSPVGPDGLAYAGWAYAYDASSKRLTGYVLYGDLAFGACTTNVYLFGSAAALDECPDAVTCRVCGSGGSGTRFPLCH